MTTRFSIRASNAINQIQNCLEEISKPQLVDSTTAEGLELDIFSVEITPQILALLIEVLNSPRSKNILWNRVGFYRCKFAQAHTSPVSVSDYGCCSNEDDIPIFASAVACRTSTLILNDCPEILDCLCNVSQLQMKSLSLYQIKLSAWECTRLGHLIQKSVALKELNLHVASMIDPLSLAEGFVNAVHLHCVSFKGMAMPIHQPPQQALSASLFRDGGKNPSFVERLLAPSPSRQLKELYLQSMNLEDPQFTTIVQLLPSTQLEILDVLKNHINTPGIMAFAEQLPKIKCLRQVQLRLNSWDYARDNAATEYAKCCTALLQGMLENYSIESMPLMQVTALERQIEYCTHINRVKGQILRTFSDDMSVGLWPWILEKVGTLNRHLVWDEELKFQKHTANALYLVLQNSGPILSSMFSTSTSSSTTRKTIKEDD